MAGLCCDYSRDKFHYLYLGYDEKLGKVLNIMSCNADLQNWLTMPMQSTADIPRLSNNQPIFLRVEVNYDALQFS
jgi:xylan 1,4-beta-xylosidase